jgi:hypothetical protein
VSAVTPITSNEAQTNAILLVLRREIVLVP